MMSGLRTPKAITIRIFDPTPKSEARKKSLLELRSSCFFLAASRDSLFATFTGIHMYRTYIPYVLILDVYCTNTYLLIFT